MTKTLARSAFYNILYTGQNALFPLITAAYLSRVLSPEGIGMVAYARNIVSYFTVVSLLGIGQYGMREMARSGKNTDRVFSELVVTGAAAAAVSAVAYWEFISWIFPKDPIYRVFLLEVLFQLCNVEWLYQGNEDFGFLAARSLLEKLLTLVLVILLVRDEGDLTAYCLIFCLVKGCGHVWNMLHARKYAKLRFHGLDIKRHLAPVLTLMLSGGAASLYSKLDITMLGLLGTEQGVGYYATAHKVVNIVTAMAAAVSAVFLPRLSRFYGRNEARYCESVSFGLKTVLFLALPCSLGLALVADDLAVVLFGDSFAPAAATIKILSALVLVKGVGDILCYQTILSAGQERKLVRAYLLAGAVNLALNALLIPRFGHNGAATASVVSELAANGVLLRWALPMAKPKLSREFCSCVAAGMMVMLAVVLAVRRMAPGLLRLAVSMSVGAAVYFGTVLLCISGRKGEKKHEYANR